MVEVDEPYMGGLEMNKHESKNFIWQDGRGRIRERQSKKVKATVIDDIKRNTLHGFIEDHVEGDSTVYMDDFKSYRKLRHHHHQLIRLSSGDCVNGQAPINGIESFWFVFKRVRKGTYRKISVNHLRWYVGEFEGRRNFSDEDTIAQIVNLVAGMVGK